MILIGLAVWLARAAIYGTIVLGLAVLWLLFQRRHGWKDWRVVTWAALVLALGVAPIGCGVLYVPIYSGGELIKPRLVESTPLAYALTLVVGFLGALTVLIIATRQSRRSNMHHNKTITEANWQLADPVSLLCPRIIFPDLEITTPPWPQRLSVLLSPRLDTSVPSDVVALFETARGAMVYGYFFYPLYTLGDDHLYRALEAALRIRAKRVGFTEKRAGLAKTISWLVDKGVLTPSDRPVLDALRALRNEASHPDSQSLFTPGMAIAHLDQIGSIINSLFAQNSPRTE